MKCLIIALLFLACNQKIDAHKSTAVLNTLAGIINDVIEKKFTQEEQNKINNIIQLRSELAKDNTVTGLFSMSHMVRIISMPHDPWGLLLVKLASTFKPTTTLELGTCIGISCAYLAVGLDGRHLITLESFEPLVALANNTFNALDVKNINLVCGYVPELLIQELPLLPSIDFVFDDHMHAEKYVIEYLKIIKPFLSDQAVYLFDDIHRNPSMEAAWEKIKKDEQIKITITLAKGICYHDFNHPVPRIGICIIDKDISEKIHCDINLDACKSVKVEGNRLIEQKDI